VTRRRLLIPLALCAALASRGRGAVAAELGDFKSDGCTHFPDGSYYSCCYLHEFAYWPGGAAEERKSADESLRACVKEITGSGVLAWMMYEGVRIWGGPGRETDYRWGYGWPFPYRDDYSPLTPDERRQVAEKTRALCASLRLNAATGGYVVDTDREISAAQAKSICPDLSPAGTRSSAVRYSRPPRGQEER